MKLYHRKTDNFQYLFLKDTDGSFQRVIPIKEGAILKRGKVHHVNKYPDMLEFTQFLEIDPEYVCGEVVPIIKLFLEELANNC
jgi:hypothetical protein